MSKARKKIFPKPPQRLNSKTVLELGKNSHKFRDEYIKALYNQPSKSSVGTELTPLQIRMLDRLKKAV